MTFQDKIKNEIALFKKDVDAFPWESKEAYADWLAQTYYFASETTTLLSLAAAMCEKNSKLQLRFIEHAAEEKGHDKLLIMDLKGLSTSLANYSELSSSASLYQPQYYWMHQRDPRAFFGYIVLLEGLGAVFGAMMYQRASDAHGKSSAHFLKVHSSEDIEHVERALQEISEFPADVLQTVEQNFRHAAECYRWMLRSIVERSGAHTRSTAA